MADIRSLSLNSSALRRLVLGRPALAAGLLAAFAGAVLPTAIMAHGALANDEVYTLQSWLLIGPIWVGLALLWLLVRRRGPLLAFPMGGLAVFGAAFYSDVYAQYPGAFLLLLATAVVFLSRPAGQRPATRSPLTLSDDPGP